MRRRKALVSFFAIRIRISTESDAFVCASLRSTVRDKDRISPFINSHTSSVLFRQSQCLGTQRLGETIPTSTTSLPELLQPLNTTRATTKLLILASHEQSSCGS